MNDGYPIASVVRRSAELFDYLRCDLALSPLMKAMMPIICGQMRR